MKIDKTELLDALYTLYQVKLRNKTDKIENLLLYIDLNTNYVKVGIDQGYSLYIKINTKVDTKTKQEKETIAVSYLDFAGIVQHSISQEIDLKLIQNLLSVNKSLINFRLVNRPNINALPLKEDWTKIETKTLLSRIESVKYATSIDETKGVLRGVGINPSYVTATDGHRLALCGDIAPNNTSPISLMFFADLTYLFVKESTIEIAGKNGTTHIKGSNWEYIEDKGKYPAVQQLIPNFFKCEYDCDREQLLDAVVRIGDTKPENDVIKLTFESDRLIVENPSNKSQIFIATSGNTKKRKIAFSYDYLAECLDNINCKTIVININSSTDPVIINDKEKLSNEMGLIMPVKLRK